MPNVIPKDLLTEAARTCESAASAKDRRARVRAFSADHGVSERSVWRWAAEGGWTSGRRTRADRGESVIGEKALLAAARLISEATNKEGRMLRPSWLVALDLAENRETARAVSGATLNRVLARAKLSRARIAASRDRPRWVNRASPYPNYRHEVDATHCVKLFQMKRGIVCRDLKAAYKNRPDEVLAVYDVAGRIWRYILCDHASNAFFVLYREEPGESAVGYVETILLAWTPREGSAFHGIPEELGADPGSAILAKNSPVRRWLETLGVRAAPHMPRRPRGKGSVEGLMRYWEQAFESGLAADPARDLADLNARAAKFCAYLNRERFLRRRGMKPMTRERVWLTIPQSKLRELPADLDLLRDLVHYAPQPRRVGMDGIMTLAFKGTSGFFRVGVSEIWGATGTVYVNPWRLAEGRTVDVEVEGIRYEAREVRVDAYGVMDDAVMLGVDHPRRVADSAAETAFKAALRTERPENWRSFRGETAAAVGAQHVASLSIPRRGEEIALPTAPERRISVVPATQEVLAALRAEIGEHTREDREILARTWAGRADVSEGEIVAAIRERIAARGANEARAAGA